MGTLKSNLTPQVAGIELRGSYIPFYMTRQTIGHTMQISVELPEDLEQSFKIVPETERQRFVIRAIRGQLHEDKLNRPDSSLNDVAQIISQRAEKRGLTEEKLQKLLRDVH